MKDYTILEGAKRFGANLALGGLALLVGALSNGCTRQADQYKAGDISLTYEARVEEEPELKVFREIIDGMEADMRKGYTNSTLILSKDVKLDIKRRLAENPNLGPRAFEMYQHQLTRLKDLNK
ncbi:MAG: hypothetical protein AABW80_00785 [Nanoarchaeota archaeon]